MTKADIYQRAVTFEMPNGPVETSTYYIYDNSILD